MKMKKIKQLFAAVALSVVLLLQTGCFGSFPLTNKMLEFNRGAGDKITQEIVFLAFIILPVYESTLLIDAVVLNTLEFWEKEGINLPEGKWKSDFIKSGNKEWKVSYTKGRYNIRQVKGDQKGQEIDFVFDQKDQSWSLYNGDQSYKLTDIKNNRINLYYPDGRNSSFPLENFELEIAKKALQSEIQYQHLD